MNAAEALERINEIANAGGRNEKQTLLAGLLQDDLGQFIIKWTYDPFITYGVKVKKLPTYAQEGPVEFTDKVVERVLTQLSTRELSGNAAKDEIEMLFGGLDNAGRDLLFRILSKDLKAGIANSTIEAVMPGFLPTFGVMRAHPYEEKRVMQFPVPVEPKLDGMRCTFIAKDGKGAFFTRSGKAIESLQYLAKPLLDAASLIEAHAASAEVDDHYRNLANYLFGRDEMPAFVLDTESMNGLFANSGALRRKGEEARDAELHAFDILPYDGFFGSASFLVPWEQRRALLETFVSQVREFTRAPVYATEIYEANSHEEIEALYERMINRTLANYLARGDQEREKELEKITVDDATGELKCLEGAMVKTYDGAYEKKKSYTWLKIKPEDTIDLFIVGFFNGEENSENENRMGGAIVDHKGVNVRVGGGWKSKEREELWEDWCHDANILGIDPHVGFKPGWSTSFEQIQRHAHRFKFLGRMTELEFNEVTPDGSLRHPRQKRFRDDKAGEVLREAA
jgi:ATP-dependent DNA ligase